MICFPGMCLSVLVDSSSFEYAYLFHIWAVLLFEVPYSSGRTSLISRYNLNINEQCDHTLIMGEGEAQYKVISLPSGWDVNESRQLFFIVEATSGDKVFFPEKSLQRDFKENPYLNGFERNQFKKKINYLFPWKKLLKYSIIKNILCYDIRSKASANYVLNLNCCCFHDQYTDISKNCWFYNYLDADLECRYTLYDTIQLAREINNIHKEGGFTIHNWSSS